MEEVSFADLDLGRIDFILSGREGDILQCREGRVQEEEEKKVFKVSGGRERCFRPRLLGQGAIRRHLEERESPGGKEEGWKARPKVWASVLALERNRRGVSIEGKRLVLQIINKRGEDLLALTERKEKDTQGGKERPQFLLLCVRGGKRAVSEGGKRGSISCMSPCFEKVSKKKKELRDRKHGLPSFSREE